MLNQSLTFRMKAWALAAPAHCAGLPNSKKPVSEISNGKKAEIDLVCQR